MLKDLDETLRKLLISELPVKNGEIEISFEQPKREWSARMSAPTVNLFMYDVRENAKLRQHQWQDTGNGRMPDGIAHRKRTPMRVDCFYVLTTWAADPADEHLLLTRCLMTLFRFPLLPPDRLVGTLRNPPFDIQAKLASHDQLTNPTDLWNVLDNEIRPAVSYIITLALDPWTEITGPLVSTFTMRSGQTITLPREQSLVPDEQRTDRFIIGGTVRSKKTGDPLPDVEVAIKGTGLFTTTDTLGRFRLGVLPPGEHTLVAWFGDGKPSQQRVLVPADNKDKQYDMEV